MQQITPEPKSTESGDLRTTVGARSSIWQQAVRALLLPLIIYSVLVSWAAYGARDQIFPDAVSYIRNAQYLASGQFSHSVSGYWSPLLSWFLTPLMYFQMDGLHASRIVLAIWGGLLIIASYALLRSLTQCSTRLQILILSLIAVWVVQWAIFAISPDLLLATLLLAYCATALSPQLLTRRRTSLACGIWAGFAYLAKSYALPFFLAHFTFTVAIQAVFAAPKQSLRKITRAWLTGILGFLIVAGPWIAILSYKYEKPTFSTVARIAHTIVGPEDKPRSHPWNTQLYRLAEGRTTIWETPDVMSYNHWSPFESREYFSHQVRLLTDSATRVVSSVSSYDAFRLCLPCLLILLVVAWQRHWTDIQLATIWVLGTITIYCGGFLFVFFDPRYTTPFLWPVCWMTCMGTAALCHRRLTEESSRWRTISLLAMGLLAASFVGGEALRFQQLLQPTDHTGATYREIAHEMQKSGLKGPIAGMTWTEYPSLFAAYHLDTPFLGCPQGKTTREIEIELEEFGVQTFLVPSFRREDEQFREQTTWKQVVSLPWDYGRLYLYVPPTPR